MKSFKSIILYILCILLGIALGIVSVKNQAFINVLKAVNWSDLTFWMTLFLGAIIPIVVNYASIKKQEIIKLKANLTQDKIQIIREYKAFDVFMRATVILEKRITDLSFKYEATHEDMSAPALRGLAILESHERFNEWALSNMLHIEKLNGLGSNDICDYTWYILNYLLNLNYTIEHIPDEYLWQVSIAVKNDFIFMSNEFNDVLDKYLNQSLFKFKGVDKKSSKYSDKPVKEKLKKTNLMKYQKELLDLQI